MDPELFFFSNHGSMSDPGVYADRFELMPKKIEELVSIVQGLTIHVFWTERYGLVVPPDRKDELQLRTIEKRLARTLEFDSRPLSEPRPLGKRLLGNCRDFSLLLVSMLRQQGIPARARCGFGTYFMPDHYEDHWVAEYWNQDECRWVMVDAQLDKLQSDILKIPFRTLDVPRNEFIVAGKAWQMCRQGLADPAAFGIFDMHGLGFIEGNLVRDLAALNKMEMLPWDCWGIMLKYPVGDPVDPAEFALMDQVAALTSADAPDFQSLRDCYESDPNLRMDGL